MFIYWNHLISYVDPGFLVVSPPPPSHYDTCRYRPYNLDPINRNKASWIRIHICIINILITAKKVCRQHNNSVGLNCFTSDFFSRGRVESGIPTERRLIFIIIIGDSDCLMSCSLYFYDVWS